MGTGVVAILLHQMPYNSSWTNYPCYIVFGLNVLIFVSALLISILRYTLWPELWPAMINHPTHSLFLGCFPMGLGTIVNLIVLVCVPAWGPWAATMAWALWWIDAALAVTICCSVAFLMYVSPLTFELKSVIRLTCWLLGYPFMMYPQRS
jgi:tellurite resistance protein TehA-like permease